MASVGGAMRRLLHLFRPDLSWRQRLDKYTLRNESIAGFIAAVIIIPQAAALATLAGMPPEYGIYTSIVPVMVAALFGSSWHSLSGPNTAVSIMVLATVIPFANLGTGLYIGLVLTLTLLVGLVQLVMATARLGNVLNLVSHSVIAGVTNAVGVIIIVTAGAGFLGVTTPSGDPFWVRVWNLVHDVVRANPFALAVGGITLVAAIVARRRHRRYALVIATGVGIAVTELVNLLAGSATTGLELLGNIPIQALALTVPGFHFDDFFVLQQLIVGSVAIAFVGVLQAAVIARTLAEKSGQHVDLNREIVGQGLSNVAAAFTSGFAGSASFNRSAAHHASGAETPLAAILSGVFLLVIALAAAPLVAHISTPVISAILIMVGWGLLDFADVKHIAASRGEAIIFGVVFIAALLLGLTEAVFFGVCAAIIGYLSHTSRPRVVARDHEEGGMVVHLRGNFFFGSAHAIKDALVKLRGRDEARGTLSVDVRETVYMDAAATRVLCHEAEHRRARGGSVVILLTPAQMAELQERDHCLTRSFSPANGDYDESDTVVELHHGRTDS
jgi:SulP family sulfate permease